MATSIELPACYEDTGLALFLVLICGLALDVYIHLHISGVRTTSVH